LGAHTGDVVHDARAVGFDLDAGATDFVRAAVEADTRFARVRKGLDGR
jgi:hypothetical protein